VTDIQQAPDLTHVSCRCGKTNPSWLGTRSGNHKVSCWWCGFGFEVSAGNAFSAEAMREVDGILKSVYAPVFGPPPPRGNLAVVMSPDGKTKHCVDTSRVIRYKDGSPGTRTVADVREILDAYANPNPARCRKAWADVTDATEWELDYMFANYPNRARS